MAGGRTACVAPAALLLAASAIACGGAPQASSDVYTPAHRTFASAARDFFNVRPAAVQPLPFPHKTHLAKQAMCTDCHETVERGPIAGIPSVKTCMICHSQIATDRPLIKQVTSILGARRRDSVAACLRIHSAGARPLQSRAAHPRERRLPDVPWRHRARDGGPAERRAHDGILRQLPSAEERAE